MALKRYLSIGVVLVASALLLGAVVWFVGFERTAAAVGQAGWLAFAAVGVLKAVFILAQAGAWAVLNVPIKHRARFRTLVAGTVVGQAGNIVTPSTYLGGEPFKIVYVGKMASLPYREVTGTVVLSKYLELVSFIILFSFSTVVAAVAYRGVLFGPAYFAAGVTMLVMAGALLAVSVVLWVALARRWRPLTALVEFVARIKPLRRRLARLRRRTALMEDQVSRVFCEESGAARGAFGLLFVGHVAVFVMPLAFFLAGSAHLRLGLGALCLIFVAEQFLLLVQLTPSGVGMLDGGLIATFALLGLDNAEAQCMAFLLCVRLWDAVVIGAGAWLGARAGARILAGAGATPPGTEVPEPADPQE